MEKGKSFWTESVEGYLSNQKKAELEVFVEDVLSREFRQLQSRDEMIEVLGAQLDKFLSSLSYEEMGTLKSYTGYEFRNINAIMRNNWNYEINGKLTEEKKVYYRDFGEKIIKIIRKFPMLDKDIKVYRGVGIRAFWDYGIHSLEDLEYLKGNTLYEGAFTSTAMVRETSFFVKEPEWVDNCNIEIEYLLPRESQDGALIAIEGLSYSAEQNEFMINAGSLFKVVDVEVDKEDNRARIRAILYPKALWDPYELEQDDNLSM